MDGIQKVVFSRKCRFIFGVKLWLTMRCGFWKFILKMFDGCDTFVNSDIIGFQFRNVFLSTWILNFPIDARAHISTVLLFLARMESMHSIKTQWISPNRRLVNLCLANYGVFVESITDVTLTIHSVILNDLHARFENQNNF